MTPNRPVTSDCGIGVHCLPCSGIGLVFQIETNKQTKKSSPPITLSFFKSESGNGELVMVSLRVLVLVDGEGAVLPLHAAALPILGSLSLIHADHAHSCCVIVSGEEVGLFLFLIQTRFLYFYIRGIGDIHKIVQDNQ
jgi:hypothetical protein